MKLKPWIVISIVLAFSLTSIGVTQALGWWESGEKRTPPLLESGDYSIEDIKGSFTLAEIEKYYHIPSSTFAKAFAIDDEKIDTFACKDITALYSSSRHPVNLDAIKVFVAFYTGKAIDLADGSIFLPSSASEVIKSEGSPTVEQLNYLDSHTFDPFSGENTEEPTPTIEETKGEGSGNRTALSEAAIEISGQDSFTELAKTYNIPEKDFAEAFNMSYDQFLFYQVKDLKTLFTQPEPKIGPNSIKLFVALYKEYDFDLSNSNTYLPQRAVEILTNQGNLSPEKLSYLAAHTYAG